MERIIRPTDSFKDNYTALSVYNTILKTHDSVFLTGGAGTGKSTLLKLIVENVDKNYMVVAPTGISAFNVNGKTINSVFRLPHDTILPTESFLNSHKLSGTQRTLLWNLHLLIIDEVSMVNPATLDCINAILKKVHNSSRPFGGVQVLFVGDLYQLPPIVKNPTFFQNVWGGEFFFNSYAAKNLDYRTYELSTVYRQNEDKLFADVLNDFRKGTITREELELVNEICMDNKKVNVNPLKLTVTKKMEENINLDKLSRIPHKEYQYSSKHNGNFNYDSCPAPRRLVLKKGARVMFLKNNNELKYYNGTLGTVKSLSAASIIVTTDDGRDIDVPIETWSEFKYECDSKNNKIVEVKIGEILQYPLKLAWAITVHKSQGLTLPKVHFDVYGGAFSAGQVYVALCKRRPN